MHIKYFPLPVRDQERAKSFYGEALGFGLCRDEAYGDDGWRWIELQIPGAETRIQFERGPDDRPQGPMMVLKTKDVQSTVERLRAGGAEIVSEPKPAPWDSLGSIFAEFRDSEGNRIVLTDN